MDDSIARHKLDAILSERLGEDEMKLIRGYLGDQTKRSSELTKRLRRQEQEFTTIFEMIGQISARAMNAESLLKYLLRTVMGQFMVPRLVVLRRENLEDNLLSCAATQGVAVENLAIEAEGRLAEIALSSPRPFDLTTPEMEEIKEVKQLRELGMVSCVPLVQQAERSHPAQLEGLLLLGERLAGGPLGSFERRLLGLLGQAVAITFRNELLYRRSIIDDLTQVSSRGHFDAHLNREIGRIRRYGTNSISLVMLDLDNFKKVNDSHGHLAGDEVLRQVANALRETVRSVDVVARYGGEEFAIILVEINRDAATEVAERLRQSVEKAEAHNNGTTLKITASFGVACFPEDAEDKQGLVEAADQALYRAKAEGRNKVCISPPGAFDKKGAAKKGDSGGKA